VAVPVGMGTVAAGEIRRRSVAVVAGAVSLQGAAGPRSSPHSDGTSGVGGTGGGVGFVGGIGGGAANSAWSSGTV